MPGLVPGIFLLFYEYIVIVLLLLHKMNYFCGKILKST
jgi:hypothetical protein